MNVQNLINYGLAFVGLGKYYAVLNNELTFVEVIAYEIDLTTGKLNYIVKLHDGSEANVKGHDACVKSNFYDSKEAFEGDDPVRADFKIHTADILEKLGLNAQAIHPSNTENYLVPYCWTMIDGEPQKYPVMLKTVRFSRVNQITAVPDPDPEKFDLPKAYWKTRADVLLWNDYTIKEADGSCHIVKSKMNRLTLTKEQAEAVAKIKEAFEAARAIGVRFCWDAEDECLNVININNLSEAKQVWDEPDEDEFEFGLVYKTLQTEPFETNIQMYDFWLNCDSGIGVNFK